MRGYIKFKFFLENIFSSFLSLDKKEKTNKLLFKKLIFKLKYLGIL